MGEADEEEAGCILVYECSTRYVGIHYAEDGLMFQSLGESPREAIDDMLETLNHMPHCLSEIGEDEAEMVEVMPIKVTEDDDG